MVWFYAQANFFATDPKKYCSHQKCSKVNKKWQKVMNEYWQIFSISKTMNLAQLCGGLNGNNKKEYTFIFYLPSTYHSKYVLYYIILLIWRLYNDFNLNKNSRTYLFWLTFKITNTFFSQMWTHLKWGFKLTIRSPTFLKCSYKFVEF